jgi:hypothetical protein
MHVQWRVVTAFHLGVTHALAGTEPGYKWRTDRAGGDSVIGPLGHELFPEQSTAPLSPFGRSYGDTAKASFTFSPSQAGSAGEQRRWYGQSGAVGAVRVPRGCIWLLVREVVQSLQWTQESAQLPLLSLVKSCHFWCAAPVVPSPKSQPVFGGCRFRPSTLSAATMELDTLPTLICLQCKVQFLCPALPSLDAVFPWPAGKSRDNLRCWFQRQVGLHGQER